MPFLLLIFSSFCESKNENYIPATETNQLSFSSSHAPRSQSDFISKKFTKMLPESNQVYIEKESPISQISGCTFTDIELPNMYLIKLDKDVLFFDNRFEFSTFGDYPAPIYLNNAFHGSIRILNCTFIKCKSRESNGNVLNCIGEADIMIKDCNFINCGNDKSQSIFKLQGNNEHLLNITNCKFKFDDEILSCCVIEAKNSLDIIFEYCIFQRCPVTKILNNIGNFQFSYNVVNSANKQIIFINYIKHKLNISSNKFQNNVLINSNFITLIHDLYEIILFNNTFFGFTSKRNELTHSILYFERYSDLKTNLVISECKFINNQNDYSTFQIGCSSSTDRLALNFSKCEFIKNTCNKGNGGALTVNINHELLLSNCYFINNKALLHGGAFALYNIKRTEIISCIFEENEANCNLSSFVEGRGGAIYIHSSISYIQNIYTKIINCTFTSNSAFNGYAIYIEGDGDGGNFIIDQNSFNDNYDKTLNSRSKGVITSEIMNIYKNNITESNIFTSKEDNFIHSIMYVNPNDIILVPNPLILISKSEKNFRLHFLLFGLALLIIILILIFTTRKANKSKQDNTFIFVILGSNSRKIYESSNQQNMKKYGNYCFTSYSLLIKRLAIKHLKINEQHICIFGRGKKEKFDIDSLVPNNKIIVQLTNDEIYETESEQSEIDIIPFKKVEDLIISMRSIIDISNCSNPNIILYMYDHGDEKSFSKLKFLELYLRILTIPHSSLYIYNEICKNNSMIIKIKNYFEISEIISSFTPKISQDELFFLALVAKEICPNGNLIHLDIIQSLDKKYFKYTSKKNIDNTFNYLCLYAIGEIQLEQLELKFPPFFSQYDIHSLAKIVKCYTLKYRIPDDYEVIHLVFEKGIRVIKKALKQFNLSNEQFLDFISDLRDNKQNFADKQYKKHPNHFIVTSSHENGLSPTFGTLRIDENTKIIPGSPAMGSYVIETLMNQSLGKNSISKIKKMVYGDHESLIMEYATQCIQSKKKKWVRLNINYWESEFTFKKKILIDQDNNYMINHTLEEVMNSIGFNLLSKCKIQFDKNNKCKTKKMQPLFKSHRKLNVINIRLVNINKNIDYSLGEIENDDYYSEGSNDQQRKNRCSSTEDNNKQFENDNNHVEDNNDQVENNNNHHNSLGYSKKTNIIPYSSLEDLFDDINYDSVISKDYFYKIINDVKIDKLMVFPVRFLVIFKYELDKLAENDKFIRKYPHINLNVPNKIQSSFRLNMSYVLEDEIDNFILLFYQFTVKYRINEDDVKNIFYNLANIADQVASLLSHVDKKKAYYPERLKVVT